MTQQEKEYLVKRLAELGRKRLDLSAQIQKIDKEVDKIVNKLARG